jgi:hypothetical protein
MDHAAIRPRFYAAHIPESDAVGCKVEEQHEHGLLEPAPLIMWLPCCGCPAVSILMCLVCLQHGRCSILLILLHSLSY